MVLLVCAACTSAEPPNPSSLGLSPTGVPESEPPEGTPPASEFRLGTVQLWYSSKTQTLLAIASPAENGRYALDLSSIPLDDVACPPDLRGDGSGQRVNRRTNSIVFDCADGSIYEHWDMLGRPLPTDLPGTGGLLPAFAVTIDSDDHPVVNRDEPVSVFERRELWELWGP